MAAHATTSSGTEQPDGAKKVEIFTLGSAKIESDEIKLVPHGKLGAGMFGSVWKGKCRGTQVAVKIPNKRTLTSKQMQDFMTETEIMKKIQHPYCCLFMGAAVDEGKREIKIVTELCAGDMSKVIIEDRGTPIPLSRRLIWAYQAAQGLAWLHSLLPSPILHRDLKLANLLHDQDMNIKVADFGLAQVTDSSTELWEQNPRGSLLYMAPEVYRKNHPITTKTDVHSFALVLWEFCTRQEVYEEYFDPTSFVTECFLGTKRPPVDPSWPPSLQTLFPRMWDPDPKLRISMRDVVEELEKIIQVVKRDERISFIRSVVPDLKAQQFWIDHYLDLDKVPMDAFLAQFYRALDLPLPTLDAREGGKYSLEQRKLACLQHWLNSGSSSAGSSGSSGSSSGSFSLSSSTTIAIAEADIIKFGQIIAWMGGLEIPAPPSETTPGFLDRLVDLLRNNWFRGLLNADDAANSIRGLPVGAFLVRFSLRTPGGFTVTVNLPEGVTHWIVYHQPGQGLTLDLTCGPFFRSVPELVAALKAQQKIGAPVDWSTPWGYLFHEAGTVRIKGYDTDPNDRAFASEYAVFAAIAKEDLPT